MKKRIITAALAAVLALNLCSVRPKAAGAGIAAAGIAIGVLAFNILGVMTGQYDDTAEGIGCLIENGVEGWQKAFVGTDDTPSWFASGWQQIYDTCSGWLDSGEITLNENGKVVMTYSQYLELFDLVGQAGATTDVVFKTDIPYYFFRAEPEMIYKVDRSICPVSFSETDYKCSFAPVYYTADTVYFSSSFLSYLKKPSSNSVYCVYKLYNLSSFDSYPRNYRELTIGDYTGYTIDSLFNDQTLNFCATSKVFTSNYIYYPSNYTKTGSFEITWYAFDGNTLSLAPSDLDFSSMQFGYISCKDDFHNFVQSLTDFSAAGTVPDLDDLSDPLKNILTKTKDPTLEVDTDPSIATPADAVTVTDIPGEADVTLSQLREKTNVDIDIPSIIAEKFPFCIPFDFIRIISVLCADPVAPVFRIPISTNPDNLAGFDGNQTIGELPEDFTPMFEIDEELVLDLSAVPLVQPICYTVFIISFVVMLIFSTNKMINH